jgi:hypothetical protein
MADVFISYAHEDKDEVARPLAQILEASGYTVWYDEYSLQLGDSLNQEINRGLAGCTYGVVILSPWFFAREWPRRELDGLVVRETTEKRKRILPVWHGVTVDDVARYSPILASRLAISTGAGLRVVSDAIVQVLADRSDVRTVTGSDSVHALGATASAGESSQAGTIYYVLVLRIVYEFPIRYWFVGVWGDRIRAFLFKSMELKSPSSHLGTVLKQGVGIPSKGTMRMLVEKYGFDPSRHGEVTYDRGVPRVFLTIDV